MSTHEPLIYGRYTQRQLNDQYDTGAPVDGSVEPYFERFRAQSARIRAALSFETLRYGAHERETVDFVAAPEPGAALFIWLHGGYWRRMSKDDFSFAAAPAAAARAAAAIINYPLAPEATLDDIVASVRKACAFICAHAERSGCDRRRVIAGGHSVGAQLAAMLATEVELRGLLGLSGLYDLEPVRLSNINDTIAMDAACARRQSPLYHKPRLASPLVLACGGREQPEFHRQQHAYAAAWRGWGGHAHELAAPNEDHFSIVLELADAQSTVAQCVAALLVS